MGYRYPPVRCKGCGANIKGGSGTYTGEAFIVTHLLEEVGCEVAYRESNLNLEISGKIIKLINNKTKEEHKG